MFKHLKNKKEQLQKKLSTDYHDYIFKNDRFVGEFEKMYQVIPDPWLIKKASDIQYDLLLYLLEKNKICARGGKILDIGCGKGALTARIKKLLPATSILAMDLAPTAIKMAKKSYHSLGINFKTGDIQKEYGQLCDKFNLIILSQIMWYILPNFSKITNYLIKHNLTKKNGYLLISQAFCKLEQQKYGRDIVSSLEDLLNLISLKPLQIIEINRLSNYNALILFKT